MAALIIGDFRGIALQQYQKKSHDIALDYSYLVDGNAEYSWFNTHAIAQLPLNAQGLKDIVIMLGFNDCAYSCVWETTFNTQQLAADYTKTINELITQYKSLNFYVCSINPVDADYPFAESKDGIIIKDILNAKIKLFNNYLKNNCKAAFIDSYSYLISTGFDTRDGSRYKPDTCKDILNYISINLKTTAGSSFIARDTDEERPYVIEDIESDIYWISTLNGGLNPFPKPNKYMNCSWDTLPNCTSYAWGRFYEILGTSPTLSTSNTPEQWYTNTSDGYSRGQTPVLGAIACWEGGTTSGHLAVVEKINEDGSILTSESKKDNSSYWWLTTRTNTNGNWGASSSYKFQGFIYCPSITSAGTFSGYVDKAQIISKNAYLTMSEMEINAKYIWNYLGKQGWTLNAVAGILGNMQTESSITPNRCEVSKKVSGPSSEHPSAADIEDYANRYLAAHGRFPGYGLVQWTGQRASDVPYTWDNQKYIYWCNQKGLDPADIDSQLERLIWECGNGIQFYSTPTYPMTFREFASSKLPADYLAKAFLKNYERPANPDYETRGQQGTNWYNFLAAYTSESSLPISLSNLKINELTSTQLVVSFISRNGKSGSYILKDSLNIIKSRGSLSIKTDKDHLKLTSFTCKQLIPNKTYHIYLSIRGEADSDMMESQLTFSTPQDYPSTISKIELKTSDNKLPSEEFQLITKPVSDWGYWGKNEHGYTIQLIVNGKVKQEKNMKSLEDNWSFNLSKEFKDYTSVVGDIIQIGIRTWATDDDGNKIFDNQVAKLSNPICFLKQPVVAYLNK